MEMKSLRARTPDHTETAEPGPSRESPAYKDAQVWKDLEVETGFASCTDYMEFYKNVRPDFKDRLEQFAEMPEDLVTAQKKLHPHNRRAPFVIYDLSKHENLRSSLSLRRRCHSGTELIQALRKPPGNVGVQLVLWSFEFGPLHQEMAEALILGLKLDPQLLVGYDYLATKEDYYPRSKGFRTSQTKSVEGERTNTTLSQNFMPEVANAVPVLLVAFRFGAFRGSYSPKNILTGGDQEKPPFHRSALGESRGTEDDDQTERGQLYARSVENFMAQGRIANPSTALLLLAATSPLLYMEAYRVQEASNGLQGTYKKLAKNRMQGGDNSDRPHRQLEKDLDIQHLNLRRTLEEGEAHVSQVFRYLLSEVELNRSKHSSYVSMKADWRRLIDEARCLEAEVRDYMQLQVGNLSLEESRRSIELSNIQILESQSGKF